MRWRRPSEAEIAALRAPADDPLTYDEEGATRGAVGWHWDAVLPYFKKIERDMDFDGPYHSQSGRIPVRRIFPDQWNGYSKGAAEAFEEAGFSYIPDQNGEFRDGYFPITSSNASKADARSVTGIISPLPP